MHLSAGPMSVWYCPFSAQMNKKQRVGSALKEQEACFELPVKKKKKLYELNCEKRNSDILSMLSIRTMQEEKEGIMVALCNCNSTEDQRSGAGCRFWADPWKDFLCRAMRSSAQPICVVVGLTSRTTAVMSALRTWCGPAGGGPRPEPLGSGTPLG